MTSSALALIVLVGLTAWVGVSVICALGLGALISHNRTAMPRRVDTTAAAPQSATRVAA